MYNKQTPADRSLRRDLVVLQRSRSVKDPSASPPSWCSAFAFDGHIRRVENDKLCGNAQLSLGINGHGGVKSVRTKQDNDVLVHKSISAQLGQKDKKIKLKGRDGQDHYQIRTLSEQLNEVGCHGPKRSKRRKKIKDTRKTGTARVSNDVASQKEINLASNSFGHSFEQNVKRAPSGGCGIPWNWSRLHERGKTFFDMAGRNLSCGLSDSKSKKSAPIRERNASESDNSSASTPLLVEPFESQDAWVHDYSGELGLFADSLLRSESDIDRRHQNLIHKYTPRTFRDLVGQNLVVQALSNTVAKQKVGFLYVFYGPRGTGKTSSARIFAKALNCLSSVQKSKPCSICDSCVEYDMGKSQNIREVGPVSNFDIESIMDDVSHLPSSCSHYKVFIFDNCDTMSAYYWKAISKIIDRATRKVVFVLICSSLDVLPNVTVSRCQKFFFPKLKDTDIIYALQRISTKEDLDIDKDALKLIASRSDGSLRDAKMTLEQLSLLGLRISVPLVQKLVGLISDEKLVDLLDLALSADTTNTVKTLREIMESGIEPLVFMSQLATVITDILAGNHDFIKEKPGRRFFCQQTLSKDDMERLCQALKTLSEAEKQLRVSNDRLTWLTAALLQLAPDQQYTLPPISSADATFHHSPKERPRKSDAERRRLTTYGRQHSVSEPFTQRVNNDRSLSDTLRREFEEIWLKVVDKIEVNSIKEFMYQEGKLVSFSFDSVPTVQLMFSSQVTKSKAEKYRSYILQAFESTLESKVLLQIISHSPKASSILMNDNTMELTGCDSTKGKNGSTKGCRQSSDDEIVEIASQSNGNQSQRVLRNQVSLADELQKQTEGSSRRRQGLNGWSKQKAVSIAEKLEQQNLKLEPRSRTFLCWKNKSTKPRPKISGLKIRTRNPRQRLLKFVSCGEWYTNNSPSPKVLKER